MRLKKLSAAALIAAGAFGVFGQAQAGPVALELSLVIDVSGSVSSTEYSTQILGYKNAFLDATVQTNILSFAPSGGVAVNVVQFASSATEVIGWTTLTTTTEINNFAAAIGSMARSGAIGSSTDVEDGMLLGISSITGNSLAGTRLVIDVSGDGHQNTDPACTVPSSPNYNQACAATQAARDSAFNSGIKINGLAIEDGTYGASGLTKWYNANVRTSDGFVLTASGFDAFETAVITKIGAEISGDDPTVPEPATLALLGLGLAGLGFSRRKQ